MGRISRGILGGITGTVGPVVGANWKGIDYLRSKPAAHKNKKASPRQLAQQAKFAVAMRFTNSIHELVMNSFGRHAQLMTGLNSAISDAMKRAIIGDYPAYDLLYSQVMISRGSLPNAHAAQAVANAAEVIRFDWVNIAAAIGKAQSADQVLLVAYCPEINRALYRRGATRDTLTDTLNATGFSGKRLHTWLTFLSKDGRDIADSRYTGEVTVA